MYFAVIGTKRLTRSIESPVGATGVVLKLSVERLIAVETCPPVAMIVWALGLLVHTLETQKIKSAIFVASIDSLLTERGEY